MLTRAAILAADDCGERVPVEVPEWGGVVYVGVMSGLERDRFELAVMAESQTAAGPRRSIRAHLAAATCYDAAGAKLFSAGDVEALSAKSGRALDRIYDVAERVNGLRADELATLEEKKTIRAGSGSS